jgi:2-oxoglutarate dehydrogenase E2 component (dihydrolipoamide succinyltransferase)
VGESVTEGLLSRWLKEDGARVNVDEPLFELETDKVSSEIPSPAAGVLRRRVDEGTTIEVGVVVGVIEAAEEAAGAGAGSGAAKIVDSGNHRGAAVEADAAAVAVVTPEPEVSGRVNVVVPSVGESVKEGVLARWLREDGAAVVIDEPLFELETDKVSSEIPAPAAGVLRHAAQPGDLVAVGSVVAAIESAAGHGPTSVASSTDPAAAALASFAVERDVEVSPLARRMAREEGLDLRHLKGTGPAGRIMKTDVVRALAVRRSGQNGAAGDLVGEVAAAAVAAGGQASPSGEAAATAPLAKLPPATPPSRRQSGDRTIRRVPMPMLRRRIAERLLESQHTNATLTTFNEIDMSALMRLRTKLREPFAARHGVGLSYMSFFVRAACDGLRAWPAVNASIEGNDIVHHDFCDVGVAVSTDRGLVVPVIRDADTLDFPQLEARLADLAARARAGALDLAEMQGGTFTVTNGGVFGSLLATPIINPPQSGILGMHTIKERPIAENGQVVIRPMMYVALSYDHRLIDGRESVGFLMQVKDAIENPERLMLGL